MLIDDGDKYNKIVKKRRLINAGKVVLDILKVCLGVASLICYIVGYVKNINWFSDLSLSIFTGWILFFLFEYLPHKIRDCKIEKIYLAKLEKIYDELDSTLAIVVFYSNIDKKDELQDNCKNVMHLLNIFHKQYVFCNLYKNGKYVYKKEDILSLDKLKIHENNIRKYISDLERIWYYLPYDLCTTLSKILLNNKMSDSLKMPEIIPFGNTFIYANENSENHILMGAFNALFEAQKKLQMYDINLFSHDFIVDTRTEAEREKIKAQLRDNFLKRNTNG